MSPGPDTQLPLGIGLPDNAVFSTFHVGMNADVVDALRASSGGEGDAVAYIYGATGTGKTHLLQAACAAAAQSGRRPGFLPLRESRTLDPAVIEGWEDFDLVCLDDLESVAGLLSWERALFALFNALRATGGVWLASGRDVPQALGLTLPDLASRAGSGPVFELHMLDDDGRIAALTLRASRRGLVLPEEVARFLLRTLPRDMNTLYEALARIDHAALAAKRPLTLPFVKQALGL